MVQIPVFTSQSSPKLTAPVTRGVPNLVGAAMLPYEQVSRLGSTILDVGQKKYQQELNFENEKYKAKLDHDLNLKKLALDFESEEYANQKQHEIDLFKENESHKTNLLKLSNELKGDFEINKIKIQRENKVKQTIADSWEQIYALSDIANRDPDTENALGNWENGIKNLKNELTRGIKDLYTKQLIEQELDENIALERAKVSSNINKNVLDQSEIIFQNEVETLKNNIIRNSQGSAYIDVTSLDKLIGEENIIYQRYNQGLLKLNGTPVTPDIYIEAVKKDIFTVMAENMAKEQPKRFDLYDRGGFWDDKLSTENIENFRNKADTAIAAGEANVIANIKEQKSILNNQIDIFTNPASAEYFGSEADYETLMLRGTDLIRDLTGLGLITEAQEVQKHLITLREKHAVYHTIQDLKHTSVDNINLEYLRIKKIANTPGSDPLSSVLLGEVEKLKNYVNDKKNSDPIGLAEELWGFQVPRINWMESDQNKFAENIQLYQNQMGYIKNKLGLTNHPIFRPDDLPQINNIFKTGSREEILLLSQNVAAVSGMYANDAFTELTTSAPAMAHLGKLLNLNNGNLTDATEHLVNGYIEMRNENIADMVNKVKINNQPFLDGVEAMMGDVLNEKEETAHQISQSTKYIFASMIAESSELRGLIKDESFEHPTLVKAHKKAMQLAAGLIVTPEGAKGGIELYNGKPIIIPQEKLNGTLRSFDLHKEFRDSDAPPLEVLLDNYLTNELLFLATGSVSATPVDAPDAYMNGMPVEFDFNGKMIGELQANHLFGDYNKIYLQTNDLGEYFILFGDPGAEHEYYKTRYGRRVVLNINRILPQLMEAYNENPVGEIVHSTLPIERK